MGGSRAEPNSTHKRSKYDDMIQKANQLLNSLDVQMKFIEMSLERHLINQVILESTCQNIVKSICNCQYPEFQEMVAKELYNLLCEFSKSLDTKDLLQITEKFEDVKHAYKRCKDERKNLSHIIRFNRYQQRMKRRYH